MLRKGVLYAGSVWAFGQGLSQFSPALGLPDWTIRWFLIAAAVGFPFWIAFAWFYEFTPQGLKRDAALATLIAKYAKADPYNIASVYAYRGEANLAFIWLDQAVQAADPQLAGIQVDPLLDKLHTDPRWLPLLRKLGRAPEQLAKIAFTVTLPGAAASAGAT